MQITIENLVAELQRLEGDLGRTPRVRDMEKDGKYAFTTYQDRFGSWKKAIDAAGIDRPEMELPISDDELLEELDRLADEYGAPPTIEDVREHSGVPSPIYEDRFSTFESAVEAAGYDPATTKQDSGREPEFSDGELIATLQELAEELGRSPTSTDVSTHTDYSRSPFYNRLGSSWEEILAAADLPPADTDSDTYYKQIPNEDLFAELDRLAAEYTEPPTLQELRDHGKYSMGVYTDRFGSWNEALEAAGYESRDPQSQIPKEDLLAELRRLAAEHDELPTTEQMNKEGKYWASTYRRHFDSWNDAIVAAGLDLSEKNQSVKVSREELLADLQRLATTDGEDDTTEAESGEHSGGTTATPPTFERVQKEGKYGATTYVRRFGSFNDALVAAGFDTRARPEKIPKTELLAELNRLDAETDGRVTGPVMDERGKYSTSTYQRRFGSWTNAVEAARDDKTS